MPLRDKVDRTFNLSNLPSNSDSTVEDISENTNSAYLEEPRRCKKQRTKRNCRDEFTSI